MATAIAPWRLRLQPASYNGVGFFMESDTKNGGRRIALHEYPKRDIPYAEDMGRRAKRFGITAYVIGPNFEDQRDALIAQLEALGNGRLIRPTTSEEMMVVVEVYSVTEQREKGGYAQFDIGFIEAGKNLTSLSNVDTQGAVTGAVQSATQGSDSTATDGLFMNSNDITRLV